jgi:hypothetical protein
MRDTPEKKGRAQSKAIPKRASGARRLASGVYLRRSVLEGFAAFDFFAALAAFDVFDAFTAIDLFDLVDPFDGFELPGSERLSDGGSDA